MTEGESQEAATAGGGLDAADQRRLVRERYGAIARGDGDRGSDGDRGDDGDWSDDDRGEGCCSGDGGDCGGGREPAERAAQLGYEAEDVEAVEDGANLGLGCGNPTAIADLAAGETVLDLGSGAGFDCFLAAEAVGPDGRVIGVDMTPGMVEKARENAAENDATNVEFRLGEIEHLPVADGSVDAIISNCVINLSPDKPRVFREARRVLRPGGRLAISDVVLTAPLPDDVAADPDSVAACVGGAVPLADLEEIVADAGFEAVSIEPKADSERFIREWDEERDLSEYVVSAVIEAKKPAG